MVGGFRSTYCLLMLLITWVDSILVVVKAGETSIEDVNKALSLLPKEKVLGLVLNKEESHIKPYPMKRGA